LRRRNWPIALAILFIAQLVWYLFYTERIVQALRTNAEGLSRIYALVQESIGDSIPPPADETLFRLQGIILETGVPLVLTGRGIRCLRRPTSPSRPIWAFPRIRPGSDLSHGVWLCATLLWEIPLWLCSTTETLLRFGDFDGYPGSRRVDSS
jgi:hypothetical protein